jgi:hypothetical protein
VTAAKLLAEAHAAGVRLRLAPNGSTKVAGTPSPELLARLRAAKPELTELLAGNRCRHWADDRAWIGDVGRACAPEAKLQVLAAWVAAAGGETCGRTVMLPALRPQRERRLTELELRRMLRQAGLDVVDP